MPFRCNGSGTESRRSICTRLRWCARTGGSLIGLRLATDSPKRFARVILSNGGLPNGAAFSTVFSICRAFSRYSPWFPIGRIVQGRPGVPCRRPKLPTTTRRFPRPNSRRRRLPIRPWCRSQPMMSRPPRSCRAWQVFDGWSKPFICCFSDGDPITRGADAQSKQRVPGARNQAHTQLYGGHFIQEDAASAFADIVIENCRAA